MNVRVAVVSLMLLGALACDGAPNAELLGSWTVTDHVAPDGARMVESEANRVHGATATFEAKRAVVLRNTCTEPKYNTWVVGVRHFESDYGVLPTRVGIPGDSIRIFSVDCKGQWKVPASELIVVSNDRLLFMWDGVFFLMTRDGT